MPSDPLEIRARSLLARLRGRGAALVAVSGGSDSIGLLRLMVAVAPPGVRLGVMHVNHGWRGAQSNADEAFVAALALRFGLPFVSRRLTGDDRREAAARHQRLLAFRAMAQEFAANTIVLAHTYDDQIETIALRLLRGSGVRGLRGLASMRRLPLPAIARAQSQDVSSTSSPSDERRRLPSQDASSTSSASDERRRLSSPTLRERQSVAVYRPLLALRRAEIRAYLERQSQPFREDASNHDLRYARNALRHVVLPTWREQDPRLDAELLQIARAADAVRRASLRAAQSWRVPTPPLWQGCAFRLPGDARFLLVALQEIAQHHGRPLERATWERLSRWLAQPARTITLRAPLVCERRGDLLLVGRPLTIHARGELRVPGCVAAHPWPGSLQAEWADGAAAIDRELAMARRCATMAVIDASALAGSLCYRPPRAGEPIKILGAPGERSVMKVLADRNAAPWQRNCWLIVADHRGPLWIAGIAIAERGRVTGNTQRALVLRWQPPASVAAAGIRGLL